MVNNIDNLLLEIFDKQKGQLAQTTNGYITEFREGAIDEFACYGLPTKKEEDFKYSDISKWFSEALSAETTIATTPKEMAIMSREDGVVVCDLNTFAREYNEVFERYYTKSIEDNAMMMLSRAFALSGTVVYVPKNAIAEVVIALSNEFEGVNLGERNLLIVERGALAKIHIENNNLGVTNCVTEIFVEDGANVEISQEIYGSEESVWVGTISANVASDAFYKHIVVNMSDGLCRATEYITLDGKGSEASIYGAVFARGNSHIDNTTIINHNVERCRSFEQFKCIAGDKATAVFNGNIYVATGADVTEAYQQNNNIILNEGANVYSKPNLVIHAEDVKCSHGATVGQLDEQALFYMRQRGIPVEVAKMLMLKGYLRDIANKISSSEIVEKISERIDNV